jgi:nucleoside-diphosphate-sugar epimerase
MTEHVVVGAGHVGTATARRLAAAGAAVTLLNRSGTGPDVPGVRRASVDARDGDALTAAARGAGVLYLCVNPPRYDQWAEAWPPMTAGFLAAAEATGAVLAIVGNLYPYGPVDGPMREGMPDRAPGKKAKLRAALTAEALARHRAGRIRAVEVRASDFVGAAAQSHLDRVLPRALSGRPVRMIGAVDQPHSWTWVEDVARTLVTAAGSEAAWGRVWHVPTNPPRSQRDGVHDHCRAAGAPLVPVRPVPHLALRAVGLVRRDLAELEETRYQFVRPYVLDSAVTEAELGLRPTPWDEICRANVARVAAEQAGRR